MPKVRHCFEVIEYALFLWDDDISYVYLFSNDSICLLNSSKFIINVDKGCSCF